MAKPSLARIVNELILLLADGLGCEIYRLGDLVSADPERARDCANYCKVYRRRQDQTTRRYADPVSRSCQLGPALPSHRSIDNISIARPRRNYDNDCPNGQETIGFGIDSHRVKWLSTLVFFETSKAVNSRCAEGVAELAA